DEFLARPTRRLGFGGRGECRELIDIGAGDEAIGLAGADDQRPDRRVVAELPEYFLELHRMTDRKGVDGLTWDIQSEDGNSCFGYLGRDDTHVQLRCSTMAKPIPPWAQTEISPNSTSRRFISLARVVASRAPVAPNGWPIAIEPPMTLVRVQSTSPT